MAVDKLMLETFAQDCEVNALHICEIGSKAELVVYLLSDNLIPICILCVKETIKLNKMIGPLRRRTPRISNPDNIFFPINIRRNVLKRSRCIKTVQIIEGLRIGFVGHHVSSCMAWWIAISAPHVEGFPIIIDC